MTRIFYHTLVSIQFGEKNEARGSSTSLRWATARQLRRSWSHPIDPLFCALLGTQHIAGCSPWNQSDQISILWNRKATACAFCNRVGDQCWLQAYQRGVQNCVPELAKDGKVRLGQPGVYLTFHELQVDFLHSQMCELSLVWSLHNSIKCGLLPAKQGLFMSSLQLGAVPKTDVIGNFRG